MSFGFQIKENTVWASIDGEVDMQVAGLWREALERQLNATLARNLVFDFSGVRFIGHVRIIGANPQVYKILQLSGFANLMDIEQPLAMAEAGGRI